MALLRQVSLGLAGSNVPGLMCKEGRMAPLEMMATCKPRGTVLFPCGTAVFLLEESCS